MKSSQIYKPKGLVFIIKQIQYNITFTLSHYYKERSL